MKGRLSSARRTNSYDADGELVASLPVPPLTLDQLNEAAAQFVGDLMQTPPMVSAVKKDGVPLYKLARKGIEVPREPRLVHIYNFRFSAYQEPLGQFRIACTKGTYVRSIAHELGQKTRLRRPPGDAAAGDLRQVRRGAGDPAGRRAQALAARAGKAGDAVPATGAVLHAGSMNLIHAAAELKPAGRKVCLAIGFFDGVHLGHQQIIRQTLTDAGQHEAIALVITFDRHPNTVVAPSRVPPLIYPLARKLQVD